MALMKVRILSSCTPVFLYDWSILNIWTKFTFQFGPRKSENACFRPIWGLFSRGSDRADSKIPKSDSKICQFGGFQKWKIMHLCTLKQSLFSVLSCQSISQAHHHLKSEPCRPRLRFTLVMVRSEQPSLQIITLFFAVRLLCLILLALRHTSPPRDQAAAISARVLCCSALPRSIFSLDQTCLLQLVQTCCIIFPFNSLA